MKNLILLITLASLLTLNSSGQEKLIISRENCSVYSGIRDTIDGRPAFSGLAIFKDIQFKNGTIEWDMWAEGGRSYAGVIFRQQANRDAEEFYVRPHKGNGLLPDAFQYTPVYHGVSCWQLSHGPGGTQPAVIPPKEWIHFKLSVRDEMAYIIMETTPAVTMLIPKLWLGNIFGAIGIKGPADGSAWFSNVSWTPEILPGFPGKPLRHKSEPGIIRDWEISKPLLHNEADQYAIYSSTTEWTKAAVEKDGLVNLTKQVVRNPQQPGWIYARTTIESESESLHRYQLAYSDYITVFINGQPIMSSTNGYTSRDPAFAGLIGYFDEVFLPLKKGKNELCLLVGEQFGGWGFKMRDGEATRLAGGIQRGWEINHGLGYPESVVYDKYQDIIFTSSFISETGGGITKVSSDGKIIEYNWAKGLRSPTGLEIAGDKLYAIDRGGVNIIDKHSGEIMERIALAGSVFPNDITIDDKGTLYISDSGGNKIYRVSGNKAEVWMEGGELKNPNGIDYHNGFIYVGSSGDACLKKIETGNMNTSTVCKLPPGSVIDGLQVTADGEIFFSVHSGYIYRVNNSGKAEEVVNTISTQLTQADFEIIEDKRLIVVPGLYSNSIQTYKY